MDWMLITIAVACSAALGYMMGTAKGYADGYALGRLDGSQEGFTAGKAVACKPRRDKRGRFIK